MNLGSRIAAWFGGKKLPYDAEVEWLEATGGQTIDSGIETSLQRESSVSIEIEFIKNKYAAYKQYSIIGCYYSSREYLIGRSGGASVGYNDLVCNFGNVGSVRIPEAPYNKKMVVGIYPSKNKVVVEGVEYDTSYNNLNQNGSIHLFSSFNTTTKVAERFFEGKILKCRMFDANNVLLRDYVCIRKDGVGYMYDRVSGELFGNSGTGAFIIGPDKLANGGGYKWLISLLKSLWRRFSRVLRNASKEVRV